MNSFLVHSYVCVVCEDLEQGFEKKRKRKMDLRCMQIRRGDLFNISSVYAWNKLFVATFFKAPFLRHFFYKNKLLIFKSFFALNCLVQLLLLRKRKTQKKTGPNTILVIVRFNCTFDFSVIVIVQFWSPISNWANYVP